MSCRLLFQLFRVFIGLGLLVSLLSCSGQRKLTRFEIDYLVGETDRMLILDDVDSAAYIINQLAREAPRDTLVLRRQGEVNRELGSVEGRRKSASAFRQLLKRDRHNPLYRTELARTLIEQTYEQEARYHLSYAIDLDSTQEEPYLLLSKLYRQPYFLKGFEEDADSTELVLNALVQKIPHSSAGWTRLAELKAIRGDTSGALHCARRALALDSSSVDAHLVMGYLQYLTYDLESADNSFSRAMSLLSPEELLPYTTIEQVIPPQRVRKFKAHSPEVRDTLSQVLWRASDLDPTTEVNERQIEHFARVWKANLLFSHKNSGRAGWTTDIGETLIRLGEPDDKEHKKIGSYGGSAPAWLWYYTSIPLPCTLAFVDHSLSGSYRFPFPRSDNTGSGRVDYSKLVAHLNYHERPEESTIRRERLDIPIYASAYQFADHSNTNREPGETELLLVIRVPTKSLIDDETPASQQVHFRAALQDSLYHTVRRVSTAESLGSLQQIEESNDSREGAYAAAILSLTISPGSHRFSGAVEPLDKNRLGVASDTISIRSMAGKPSISDLVLTSASSEGKARLVTRGEHTFTPRFTSQYSLSEPVVVYFEIYNLPRDIRGQTRYHITYALEFVEGSDRGLSALLRDIWPGKKETVSHTYREGGRNTFVQREVAIDVGELRPGVYTLTVVVEDLILGGRAERTTHLTLQR